jgi:hypothetical protein
VKGETDFLDVLGAVIVTVRRVTDGCHRRARTSRW